jgi:hypothetical protein
MKKKQVDRLLSMPESVMESKKRRSLALSRLIWLLCPRLNFLIRPLLVSTRPPMFTLSCNKQSSIINYISKTSLILSNK